MCVCVLSRKKLSIEFLYIVWLNYTYDCYSTGLLFLFVVYFSMFSDGKEVKFFTLKSLSKRNLIKQYA